MKFFLKSVLILVVLGSSFSSCNTQAQPSQQIKSQIKNKQKLSYQYAFGGRGRTRSVNFKAYLQDVNFEQATLVIDTFRLELKVKTKEELSFFEAFYMQMKEDRDDEFESIILFENLNKASILIETDKGKRFKFNSQQLTKEPNIYYP